jgi:hypothetical protein
MFSSMFIKGLENKRRGEGVKRRGGEFSLVIKFDELVCIPHMIEEFQKI